MTITHNNLNTNITQEAELQVETMLLTRSCTFDDPHDFSSSIHNFVEQAQALGEAGTKYRTNLLKTRLEELGINEFPNGDFVFFGGRCIPTPNLFLNRDERENLADALAEDIVSKAFTTKLSGDELESVMTETLIEAAAMDTVLLSTRTEKLIQKMNHRFPDLGLKHIGGPVTFLANGAMLPLHYVVNLEDEYTGYDEPNTEELDR